MSLFVGAFAELVPGRLGHAISHPGGGQRLGWDAYLLVVSLLLVWLAGRARVRGLGYVGGAGLFAFAISAGLRVEALGSGAGTSHRITGWPVVLVIVGAAAMFTPVFFKREQERC